MKRANWIVLGMIILCLSIVGCSRSPYGRIKKGMPQKEVMALVDEITKEWERPVTTHNETATTYSANGEAVRKGVKLRIVGGEKELAISFKKDRLVSKSKKGF